MYDVEHAPQVNPLETAGVTADLMERLNGSQLVNLALRLLRDQLKHWHPDQGGDVGVSQSLLRAMELLGEDTTAALFLEEYRRSHASFTHRLREGREEFATLHMQRQLTELTLASYVMKPGSEWIGLSDLKDCEISFLPINRFLRELADTHRDLEAKLTRKFRRQLYAGAEVTPQILAAARSQCLIDLPEAKGLIESAIRRTSPELANNWHRAENSDEASDEALLAALQAADRLAEEGLIPAYLLRVIDTLAPGRAEIEAYQVARLQDTALDRPEDSVIRTQEKLGERVRQASWDIRDRPAINKKVAARVIERLPVSSDGAVHPEGFIEPLKIVGFVELDWVDSHETSTPYDLFREGNDPQAITVKLRTEAFVQFPLNELVAEKVLGSLTTRLPRKLLQGDGVSPSRFVLIGAREGDEIQNSLAAIGDLCSISFDRKETP